MRKMNYLHTNRIIYRRYPIKDKASLETKDYFYYENGTHECYELFRSKAKITTIKSLTWHLTVLWYLNEKMDYKGFIKIANYICDINNNFITFTLSGENIKKTIEYILKKDLEKPPKNKLRKILFKDGCVLNITEKLKIVGSIIGRTKKIDDSDIYEAMIFLNDNQEKITIIKLSSNLNVTQRTIYRRMTKELNKEKHILNKLLNEKIQY